MRNRERNYLFDNLKALLITLVTAVHMFAVAKKASGIESIWLDMFLLTSCAFHMPLFAYISGYFSKNAVLKGKKNKLDILIVYFLAQIILVLFQVIVLNKRFVFSDLWIPGFSMWYLVALFVWRMAVPALSRIRYVLLWCALLNVFAMGLGQSGAIGKTVIRTLSFLVFFLAGFYSTEEMLAKIRKQRKWHYVIGLIIAVATIYFITTNGIVSANTFRGMMLRTVSVSGKIGWIKGYLIYAYLLLIPMVMGACLIGLFPEKKLCISYLGKNSMTIYIGQAVVYLLYYKKMIKWDIFQAPVIASAAAIILTIGCLLIFGNDIVSDQFNRLVRRIKGLFYRE